MTSELSSSHLQLSTASNQIIQINFPYHQTIYPLFESQSRVLITNEQIRFEIITLNDSGEYHCEISVK